MSTQPDVTAEPSVRLFTRQATGLRREVSPLSTLIFNIFSAPTPFILSIALFWTLGVFPGANLYVALVGGYVAGMVVCFAFSTLASAIPRSGGDYVLVGRVLKPIFGTVSSFCNSAGVLLSAAAIAYFAVTIALAPSLVMIGLTTGNGTFLDWGTTLSTDKGWQFAIGALFVVLAAVVAALGWKPALRVQAVGFGLGMLGLVVAAIVLLLNSGSDFVNSFNSFAGPITGEKDSYHHIIAVAQQEGINTDPGSKFSNTWPAFGAVMGFSIYAFYSMNIGSEVQQARSWKTTATIEIPRK